MASRRTSIIAGTILGGTLLLGTAGLALAQGPTTTPAPSPSAGTFGGMMSGQDMMGGQLSSGQDMMGGQLSSGQDMMGGSGMMGGGAASGQGMMGSMDAGDIAAMHQAMDQNGACNTKLMQSLHDKYVTSPSPSPKS